MKNEGDKVKWWHIVAFAVILIFALIGESLIDKLLESWIK